MKTRTLSIFTIAASAAFTASPLFAQATAVTAPVGYRTETIAGGVFNLLNSNLQNPVLAAGALESATAASVTDAEATFTTSLTGTGQFVLKLTSGTGAGLSSVVTVTNNTTLATVENLSSFVTGGQTFEIRKSPTVSELFGATNQAGLAAGNTNSTGADIVWVQNTSAPGFTRVYYNGTAGTGFGAVGVGWKGVTSGNTDQSNLPAYFTDGLFIQRISATPLNIVFTGHVMTTASEAAVETGFNFVSRVLPVGVTLAQSGLETELAQGNTNATVADLIWVPNGSGGYNRYYYNGTAGTGFGAVGVGWKGATTGNTDQSAVSLTSGIVIERKGGAANVTLKIPAGLDL